MLLGRKLFGMSNFRRLAELSQPPQRLQEPCRGMSTHPSATTLVRGGI
jgi:hypothetical protein